MKQIHIAVPVFTEEDSEEEELIDDETFLARHLPKEIEEIKRYNIGVQQKRSHGSAQSLSMLEKAAIQNSKCDKGPL